MPSAVLEATTWSIRPVALCPDGRSVHGERRCANSAFTWSTVIRPPGASVALQPYGTTRAIEREDIPNVGGFSDHVFEIMSNFAAGRLHGSHWIERIELVVL